MCVGGEVGRGWGEGGGYHRSPPQLYNLFRDRENSIERGLWVFTYCTLLKYATLRTFISHIIYRMYIYISILYLHSFFVQVNFFKIKIKNINFFLREQENDNDEDFFTVKVDSNV